MGLFECITHWKNGTPPKRASKPYSILFGFRIVVIKVMIFFLLVGEDVRAKKFSPATCCQLSPNCL